MLHLAISTFGGKMNKLKNLMSKARNRFPGINSMKKTVLVSGAVLLVLVATYSVRYYQAAQDRKLEQRLAYGGCNQKIIEDASPYLKSGYETKLQSHVEKIKALPEFKSDPNCLYIASMYEAKLGSIDAAKEYLALLEGVYDEDRGFSPHFNDVNVSIESLRAEIARMETTRKIFDRNHGIFNSSQQRRQE